MSNITKAIILDETGARIAEALETMVGGGSSAKAESIASPYDPTETYDVGEKCTYNGKYYKCIVQIATAEEWDVTHWEETTVDSDIDEIMSDLTSLKDGMGEGEEIHLNLLDTAELTSNTKYYDVSNAGALRLNSPTGTVTYSSYIIPAKENQLYTANYNVRYIIPLDNSKEPLVSRSQMIETSRSVDTTNYPGTKYIAASFRTDNVSAGFHWIFSEGDTPSDEVIPGGQALPGWCQEAIDEIETEIRNLDIKPRKNRIYMLTDTSFSEEKKFTEFATSVKAKCMHLVVNLTTFTSVKVGLRSDAREVFYAQITDSTVNLYDYNGGLTEHTASYSHGLTIGDNLSIDVYAEANTGKYYVCVGSDGDEYTTTTAFNIAPTGLIYPFASMVGTASFVQFSAECNTQRPIWLFGDSYLGTNNTARWAYYLVSREKDSRVMMDAFAGENSTSAFASLEALINSGVPDYIVWCLGMNDGGDTGTTPNTTWMSKVNSLIELCEANKIIPIFATIPTVPSVNNEGKNKWVRESGHQFIDFAKAVGATSEGVWFTGMLSTDSIHPSATGAVTLYHAALAGCPQFSQT